MLLGIELVLLKTLGNKMTKFIQITIVLAFFYTSILADDCGQPQYCSGDKQYPYTTCDVGFGLNAKCSSNPLLEMNPAVLIVPFPICLKLSPKESERGPTSIKMPDINNETGVHEVEIYNRIGLEAPLLGDFDCAENAWNCICGKENSSCQCEIFVKFSSRIEDISGDPYVVNATARYITYSLGDGTCDVLCNGNDIGEQYSSYILINNTNQKKRIRNGKVTQWYYNNSKWDDVKDVIDANNSNEYAVYNLCDVLQHELGHMYGLQHFDEHCISEGNTGQMKSVRYANQPYSGLSNDDKCAFMKLYCNNLVSVQENQTSSNVRNFPNPAINELNIEFNVKSSFENVSILCYDVYGKYLGTFYNKVVNKGVHNTQINLSGFVKGVYFYKIELGDTFIFKNFVKTD